MLTGLQQMKHQEIDNTLAGSEYLDDVFVGDNGPVKVLAEVISQIPMFCFAPTLRDSDIFIAAGVVHNEYIPAQTFPLREGKIYIVTEALFPIRQERRAPGPSSVSTTFQQIGLNDPAPPSGTGWEDKEILVDLLATVRRTTNAEPLAGSPLYVLEYAIGYNHQAMHIPVLGYANLQI